MSTDFSSKRLSSHKSPRSRGIPLRLILVVPFVVQIVGAVGLVGYLSYRSGQESINDLAAQLRSKTGDQIKDNIENFANTPYLIAQITEADIAQDKLDPENLNSVEKNLWQQVRLFKYLSFSSYGNEKGEYRGANRGFKDGVIRMRVVDASSNYYNYGYNLNSAGNRTQLYESGDAYDPRKRGWYKSAKANGKAAWYPIYKYSSDDSLGIGISVPFYNKNGGFGGAFAIDMNLAQISNFLNSLKIGRTGQAFIIERDGNLVASSNLEKPFIVKDGKVDRLPATSSQDVLIQATVKELKTRFQDESQKLSAINSSQEFNLWLQDKRQFLKVIPFQDGRGLDWLIVVIIPEDDFMHQINANTQTAILLCLATLILAILLGILTARWIIRPVERITTASEAIAEGNLNQQVEVSSIVELGKLANVFNGMTKQLKDSLNALHLANEELEDRVEQRTGELRLEKERSEQLLLNILPPEIADRLMRTNESPAEHFEEATILFADIVGFTTISARIAPMQLVAGLNQIFSAFDQLTEKYGLEKIKTIGDAYMVVGGLPVSRPDHAEAIANMALDMQAYMQEVENIFGESLQIRIGINTGPVIAGVIGIKKFIYDLWGDAVNVASRMESHGKPGYIQVTDATYLKLQNKYLLEPRGTIDVKGRGEMMTYWLLGRRG